MIDLNTVDLFNDRELTFAPYPLIAHLAANEPVWREPVHGVVVVAGYDEVLHVLRNPDVFSSANVVSGPTPFPESLADQGLDDVSGLLAEQRYLLRANDQIPTFDPPHHTAHRAMLMGMITPKRLKENEDFIWRITDRQLDKVLAAGRCELIEDYAHPYALLVVADLLGVPESDHETLLTKMGFDINRAPGVTVGVPSAPADHSQYGGITALYDYFIEAIEDRRRDPKEDVLGRMALATFPDGSTPEPLDVARIAANLFSAGQETTVRLLGTVLQRIADYPEVQALVRQKPELVGKLIEEVLRTEGPIKGNYRMALTPTSLGGVDIPAGTVVMVMNGGANLDPRKFENPTEFQVERPNVRRHVAFGHGIHTCPGAPLARSEVRITVERLLERTSDIRVSEEAHGPVGARRYGYLPSSMFRGLTALNLEFTQR